MAKMFYSLEEAAEKLSVSEDEVRSMVSSGQIQEFRDGEKLLFKVEQIDLLAGGEEEEEEIIPLAAPGEDIGIDLVETEDSSIGLVEAEGSSIGLAGSGASGISVFDADDVETADPAALTQISETAEAQELNFETVGSGSGLLDLTREADDTSLGAELLDEIYPGEDQAAEMPASASGLFESTGEEAGADADASAAGRMMATAAVETLDGFWSGASMGLLFGALVALVVGIIITITGLTAASPAIVPFIAKDFNTLVMYGGGLLAGMVLLGIIGGFIGKKS
ncbi:MAG: helix-turn-helix domain-containing protein [Phycisphaerales bacterium]|nr:helix-turn-helix domain-containing protein [Phycisphaerales bacterium]